MGTKGIGFVFSCYLIYAGIAAIGVGGSVAFLLRAFTTTPGECEAGWVGGVGLSTSFLAVGYIFGSIAYRGLRASVIANRHVGGVEIHRDLLVIDSPGVLATPAIVHRDWISTIDTAESRTLAAGALLTLCYQSRFTDIRLVQPVGLPSAVGVPGFPSVASIHPPQPWQKFTTLSVDLEAPIADQAVLTDWLARPSESPAPPPPPPTARDRTRRYQMAAAIAVALAGVAAFILSIPSGPAC